MNEVNGHGISQSVEPLAKRPLPPAGRIRSPSSSKKNGASVVEPSGHLSDVGLPSAAADHYQAETLHPSGFESILFPNPEEYPSREQSDMPECFKDLNLDQVVDTITSGRSEYNLKPFFYISLNSLDHISYRHEIAQDLEDEVLHGAIQSFAERLRTMRKHLAQADELRYTLQKQAWFLEATAVYTEAILVLGDDLAKADIQSRGLLSFRSYVQDYVASAGFGSLRATVGRLKDDLAAIRYDVFTIGATFKVRRYAGESDYSAEIEEIFAKFRQGGAKDYSHKLQDWVQMNDVEARILQFVAALNSEVFARLDEFTVAQTGKFVDKIVGTFDREVQFYLAYRAYIATMKEVGLKFCYPSVSDKSKHVLGRDAFDIALASKLAAEGSTVVANDFKLSGKERILVVSGPNQGGKTTFARTFGQMHYLAGIGCQVPGHEARLFLADAILTHFEREEDIQNLHGKLEDDLVRIHDILDRATPRSVVIMNEIFTSTTLRDATFLSGKVMDRIIALDALCVWVTFIHELATFSDQTVSMVSMVDAANSAVRTFKVVRKSATGRSYAMSIAEKHGLTSEQLKERLGS